MTGSEPTTSAAARPPLSLRRVCAVVIGLCGAALVVIPIALGSVGRAHDAQQLLDGARPIVTPPALQQHFDAGLRSAARTEALVAGPVASILAADLHETAAGFQAEVRQRWPTVAALAVRAPRITAQTSAILRNLHVRQHDFQQADSIPVGGTRLALGVWVAIAFGTAILVGAVVLWSRPERLVAVSVLVVALVFVVGGLAVGLPAKASSAERVLGSINLNVAKNRAVHQSLSTVQGAFAQFEDQLLPDVARDLGTAPAALRTRLESAAPGLGPGLQQVPRILGFFATGVRFREENVGTFASVRYYPFRDVVWVELALAAVIAAAAAVALLARRAAGRA